MAPLKGISVLYLILSTLSIANAVPAATTKHTSNNHAQFVHEKEETKPETNTNNENDDYHLTNDYKPDPAQQFPAWNPFPSAWNDGSAAARYLGLVGYPNPMFVPYPVFVPQESYYPYQDYDEYDDIMSRAGGRRGSNFRNSPVYYIRLPPTPYMFIPGIGYHSQPPTFTPNFVPPFLPYNPIQSLPVQPAINPFINVPMPFISNGRPTGIYQLDSNSNSPQQYQPFIPNSISNGRPTGVYQFDSNSNPAQQYQPFIPSPPSPPTRPYRPSMNPPPYAGYNPSDTKISQLKRPFAFNGRPEQIYVLQSAFNPMYQSQMPGYY